MCNKFFERYVLSTVREPAKVYALSRKTAGTEQFSLWGFALLTFNIITVVAVSGIVLVFIVALLIFRVLLLVFGVLLLFFRMLLLFRVLLLLFRMFVLLFCVLSFRVLFLLFCV